MAVNVCKIFVQNNQNQKRIQKKKTERLFYIQNLSMLRKIKRWKSTESSAICDRVSLQMQTVRTSDMGEIHLDRLSITIIITNFI